MKKQFLQILKPFSFVVISILIFFLLHIFLSSSFSFQDYSFSYTNTDSNITDVVVLGSSHVHSNIQPAVLWGQHGIAAYNCSCDGSSFTITYFDLLKLLHSHKAKPKLVIIDIYSFTQEFKIRAEQLLRSVNYFPDFSLTHIQRVLELAPKGQALDYFLQYPIYHTRYAENTFLTFKIQETHRLTKGGLSAHYLYKDYYSTHFELEALPDVSQINHTLPLTEEDDYYLQKTISLAKSENVPLLFINAPFAAITQEYKEQYNSVKEIVLKSGFDFIDFNDHMVSMGLNSANDFREGSHLTYTGMEKYSLYLGDYLKKNYDLPDHRGDPVYQSYDQSFEIWNSFLKEQALREESNPVLYLEKLPEYFDGNTVIISTAGEQIQSTPHYAAIQALLSQYKIDLTQYNNGGTWVIENSRVTFDSKGQNVFSHRLLLGSTGAQINSNTRLQYGTELLDAFPDGIMIFIYNHEYDELLDAVKIDAYWSDYITHFFPTMQPVSANT